MGGTVLVQVLLCSVGHPFVAMKGEGWLISATCVPWYVPRGSTGLSKHGDPVSPHLCPLNQNLAHGRTVGGGVCRTVRILWGGCQDVMRFRRSGGIRMVPVFAHCRGAAVYSLGSSPWHPLVSYLVRMVYGGVPCAVPALRARCAKSWLFSTTGSSVSSED